MAISDISTTKMTSKGQVVIPEKIREHMHLEFGTKFIVIAIDDSIIFKRITPPEPKDIALLLKASQEIAKKYKFNENDIPDLISEVKKSNSKKKTID